LPQGVSYPQVTVFDPKEDKREEPLLVYTLSGGDAPLCAKYQIVTEIVKLEKMEKLYYGTPSLHL
jgi:hypothetical protein